MGTQLIWGVVWQMCRSSSITFIVSRLWWCVSCVVKPQRGSVTFKVSCLVGVVPCGKLIWGVVTRRWCGKFVEGI